MYNEKGSEEFNKIMPALETTTPEPPQLISPKKAKQLFDMLEDFAKKGDMMVAQFIKDTESSIQNIFTSFLPAE